MASRKLDKSEWRAFCDHLSKALLGSDSEAVNASLSVGEEVAAEWVVLLGVAYDPRSDSFDIALGGLEHRVRKPETLYVDEGPAQAETGSPVEANSTTAFEDQARLSCSPVGHH